MVGLEGKQLADCEILSRVGQGGMGTVYKARQTELDRFVAIKVLAPQYTGDPEFLARFKREAAAAAQLAHPNIVQVFSAGRQGDTHFFVMEFVDGENLQRRVLRQGCLASAEALAICAAVARGLDYAWQRSKLIHRDVKPDNIFLSHDGAVKLGDLGLAKSALGPTSGLTVTGVHLGTPYFVSPEQARGLREIDFRADLYSLGCTLYYMVSGRLPYGNEGCDALALMYQHVHEPPPDILRVQPDCPAPLAQLISRMLQKRPEDRFQSYAELLAEVRAVGDALHADLSPQATRSATAMVLIPPVKQGPAASSLETVPAEDSLPPVAPALTRSKAKALVTIGVVLMGLWAGGVLLSGSPSNKSAGLVADAGLAFRAEVAALPAEQQVARVVAKLKVLNPGYDGKENHRIEAGCVVDFSMPAIGIRDLTPLRALSALKSFACREASVKLSGKQPKGDLADLAPLQGLRLEKLDVSQTEVADLAPLAGMPLKQLLLDGTKVRDLSPLIGAPLTVLRCDYTPLRDLTPLAKLPLRVLYCVPAVAGEAHNRKALGSLRTLETINTIPVIEFWTQVDAGKVPARGHETP